jgi:hypothetical protein
MFDTFAMHDDYVKKYKVKFSEGNTEEFTKQGLYEFFILTEHDINMSFEELVRNLETDNIYGKDMEYDWNSSCHIYKGAIVISKIDRLPSGTQFVPPPIPTTCQHKDKYVNQAGGVKFYVCRTCKADLGDA